MTDNLTSPRLPIISLGKVKKAILQLLIKGNNPYSIARELQKARSTITQHCQEMAEIGFTEKSGHVWITTERGKEYLRHSSDVRSSVRLGKVANERSGVGTSVGWYDRAHNLKVKVDVVERPSSDSWLLGWRKNDRLKNNVFYMQRFGEVVTTFTGKSLIFQLPVLKFRDANLAVAEAGKIGLALMRKYERDVPGLKLGSPDVSCQLITQHHAIPGEPFAKFCIDHGISVQGENVHIDSSKGPELEFTGKESNLHFEKYVEHVEDMVTNSDLLRPTEIQRTLQEIMRLQAEQSRHISEQAKQNSDTAMGLNALIKLQQLGRPEPPVLPKQDKKTERSDYIG